MANGDWRWQLLDEIQDDKSALRNARWLAERCRAGEEVVIPMAAMVADALARGAGIAVEVYGMSGVALGELIDHLADRYERANP